MTSIQQTAQELFNKITVLIEKYKQEVRNSEDKTNNELKGITKEYKKQLQKGLEIINSEPSSSINLPKTNDILEDLSEKSKEIRTNGKKEIHTVIDEFCNDVINLFCENLPSGSLKAFSFLIIFIC